MVGWEIGKLEDIGPLEDVKVIVSDERCPGAQVMGEVNLRRWELSSTGRNYRTSVSSFIT